MFVCTLEAFSEASTSELLILVGGRAVEMAPEWTQQDGAQHEDERARWLDVFS